MTTRLLQLFILALLAGFYPGLSLAQTLSCANPTASMLWKVDGGRDGAGAYLFGTIHVGRRDFYPLPAVIEEAFLEADQFVFEVDPRTTANPLIAVEIQRRARLPDGQTLADVLSPELLARLTRTLEEELGVPMAPFMGLKPWFITMLLVNLQVEALGYSPLFGIENYLLSRKPEQTGILELESIQEQLVFLEELDSERYLEYTLRDFEEAPGGMDSLVRAWRCADKESLHALLFDDADDEEIEAVMNILYIDRNIAMAEKVAGLLESGDERYFIAVGSAHLLGAGSMVELLREKGYEVNPVPLPVGPSQ